MGTRPPITPLLDFGKRIRHRRVELGFSQEALAEKALLHRTYVGTVERGERNPTLLTILVLAEALELDPSVLVTGLSR